MRVALIGILAVCCGSVAFPCASAQEELWEPWRPPHERWSAMPREIVAVTIGPDGRLWRQARYDDRWMRWDEVRRGLERAYRQESPLVTGAWLIFLEDSGRAWFAFGEQTLVGYDGLTWIEHRLPDGHKLPDYECRIASPRHLNDGRKVRAAAGGGATYFVDQFGAHRFDGSTWSYRPLADRDKPVDRQLLAISPDRRHVVAAGSNRTYYWEFRGGRWRRSQEVGIDDEHDHIAHLTVANDGVVQVRFAQGRLRQFREGREISDARPPKAVTSLIENLKADKFAVRESAQERLGALAPILKPQLEQAFEQSRDPEQRYRLQRLLKPADSTDTDNSEEESATPPYNGPLSRFGNYSLGRVDYLTQDSRGRIYLTSPTIIDEKLNVTAGVLVIDGDGESTLLRNARLHHAWSRAWESDIEAALDETGDRIWLKTDPDRPIALFDVAIDDFTCSIPDPTATVINAVDDRGRVFATQYLDVFSDRVRLFQPWLPDRRKALDAIEFPFQTSGLSVDSEGDVWVDVQDDGLHRFDGRKWTRVVAADQDKLISLVRAGAEHIVFLQTGNSRFSLLRDGRPVVEGSIFEVVGQAQDLIRDTLPAYTVETRRRPILFADADRNIWFNHDETGQGYVAVGKSQWQLIDVFPEEYASPISQANNRPLRELWRVEVVQSIGHANRVLLRAQPYPASGYQRQVDSRDKERYFDAQWLDGRLRLHPLPIRRPEAPGWCDGDGMFWLGDFEVYETCDNSMIEYYSVSIDRGGNTRAPYSNGHPVFADESGHVWFRGWHRRYEEPTYELRRNGRTVARVKLRGVDEDIAAFCEPSRGSVYALKAGSLLHLRADAPNYDSYRLVEEYDLGNLVGVPSRLLYSRHGFFVAELIGEQGEYSDRRSYLLRLPTDAR